MDPKLTEQCVKNLVFIGRAMHLNPELCFAEADVEGGSGDDRNEDDMVDSDEHGEDEEDEGGAVQSNGNPPGRKGRASEHTDDNKNHENTGAAHSDPLRWVFNRMSHMVVHKGEARRRAVFSWFAAMAAVHESAVSAAHLKLMLLPLRRAVLDAEAGGVEHTANISTNGGKGAAGAGGPEKEQTSSELATEVC